MNVTLDISIQDLVKKTAPPVIITVPPVLELLMLV